MGFEQAASKWLLAAAIALRILVYIFLQPINNDDHGAVVKFIVEHHRLATVADTFQGQHPPLYYLIAAPIYQATRNYKIVQMLSLFFSIATLLILHYLIYQTPLIPKGRARTYCFLFACFLPQFVMFSLYLSNDTMTIFLGNLALLQAWRAIQRPVTKQWVLLGLIIVIGLLTKLSFLAFIPVLSGLVFWMSGRGRHGLLAATAFGALVLTLGSYKLVENYVNFRSPMITGIDPRFHLSFATEHLIPYHGLASYLNFNIFKLVPEPVLSKATYSDYPVIFYATFWYQYIPESNFIGDRSRPTMYVGSVLYMLGILPTAVFLVGLWASLRARPVDPASLGRLVSVLLMLFVGLMFVVAVLRFHLWSIVQARYLFPAMFGCLVAYGAGVEIAERNRAARIALAICMTALTGVFLFYFAIECAHWI
jgi:hypothetical protein